MITKAGELVDYISAAAQEHGCTPHTEVRVRVGKLGPVYRISQLNGVNDARGFHLLIELSAVSEGLN